MNRKQEIKKKEERIKDIIRAEQYIKGEGFYKSSIDIKRDNELIKEREQLIKELNDLKDIKKKKPSISQLFHREVIIESSKCQRGTYKRKMTKQEGIEIMQCKLKSCVEREGTKGCHFVDQSKLYDKKLFKKTKDNKIMRRM